MILDSDLRIYRDLDDFLLEGDNWKLFIEVFGFQPTANYIKRHLKKKSNWTTDKEIIEKILESLPDEYVVGKWNDSWENASYAMEFVSILWVHKIRRI